MFYWILFENVMSLHRTKATFIGLLEAGRANEWIVTEKLGDSMNNKNKIGDNAKNKTNVTIAIRKSRFKFGERSVFFSKKKIISSFNVSVSHFCLLFGVSDIHSGIMKRTGSRWPQIN